MIDSARASGEFRIRPPAENPAEKKGTYDPNYQTLAGMNNDDVFKRKDVPKDENNFRKDDGGNDDGAPKIRAPQEKRIVGTYDPNYQTLANLGNDCFGQDKKKPDAQDFLTY
ncbi:hypothetical protein TELCIR_08455 [Teladorsagia circumcincta]|uniref:Uncharacterized protein n=1 Tax=Teladorsagia circumcincta TaxID=45464 RepID=A0A2G9UJ05_TELCI|nr:hypothetical protein TELCIR_08455 [Teladorsagia circumcincta]